MKLTDEERQKLNSGYDYTVTGNGGVPKTTYYTPDGRTKQAIPNIREYIRRDINGKVLTKGVRDANLDNGWLLTKPAVLKPFCKGCSRWHDTQTEVDACVIKQKDYLQRMEEFARKELHKETQFKDQTIDNLSKEVSELKEMVKKLLESKK